MGQALRYTIEDEHMTMELANDSVVVAKKDQVLPIYQRMPSYWILAVGFIINSTRSGPIYGNSSRNHAQSMCLWPLYWNNMRWKKSVARPIF